MSGIYKQHKLCYIKVLRRRRPLMEHFYSYVESAICEQVVIFLTYQKQKNIYIYICSTRKISNKNDFLLLWENK